MSTDISEIWQDEQLSEALRTEALRADPLPRRQVIHDSLMQAHGQLDLKAKQDAIRLKRWIGVLMCGLVYFWLIFVGYIIIAVGLQWIKLDNSIMITLLTTTTINILVMLHSIVKSLYPQSSGK